MIRRLWVDLAVAAVCLLGAAILLAGGTGPRVPAGGVGLLLLIAAYLWARPTLQEPTRRASLVFVGLATVSMALMTWAEPSFATMQIIVYPLVWIISTGRRAGVVGSCLVGVGMFAGFSAGFAFRADAVVQAATVAVLSVAFSIAMGWWITAIATYAEERARLWEELSAAHREVEALSRERGAGEEREHLAREIHDTLAQTLAGLVILAEQAGRLSRGGDADRAAAAVAHLETVARSALDEARALVARTAAVPRDDALEAAVERLAARFRADTGLAIDVRSTGLGVALDRDTQVVILRCLQEGLANVRKHAAAARVSIEVGPGPDGGVRVTVVDDGRGFAPASPQVGYGLEGMRDRVALAAGSVEIVSSPGGGTALTIDLPGASARIGGAA